MSKINICIIKPDEYIHSLAFLELGELIYYSCAELGHEVSIGFNNPDSSCKNILLGCHLLDPQDTVHFPPDTVILNTEQIYADDKPWHQNIFSSARAFEVWDYNDRNILKFKSIGIENAKLFRIGFQQELRRLDTARRKDVDVLFYGSVNERRRAVIEELMACGLRVQVLAGLYGPERDDWIERSHVVLNHHFYDSHIFEIVRVFYLLTNSVAVVGEVNATTSIDAMYAPGIFQARYEDLVAGCVEVVANPSLRQRIQTAAFESIAAYPQRLFTQQALES